MRLSFFFNDTATTEIYTLSLHDALPISSSSSSSGSANSAAAMATRMRQPPENSDIGRCRSSVEKPRPARISARSEEHTSELQSRQYLVCRLLLEKKKRQPRHVDHQDEPA